MIMLLCLLMHTVSFELLQPTMRVNIHNQSTDFKLTNREYFENYLSWNKYPDVEVDAGSMTSVDLTSIWAVFEGVIMYELHRKCIKSDDQLGSIYASLFIAWRFEGYKMLLVCVRLIEYDKQIKWNRIKLKEYYQRYVDQFSTYTGPIKDTWLIDDDTVLTTELRLDFTQTNDILNITVSEGIKDERTRRPVWLDPKM
jgi:hypothetical protein